MPTRTTGSTGIICSVQTRLWSRGTSATRRRGAGSAWTPISARILGRVLADPCRVDDAGLAGLAELLEDDPFEPPQLVLLEQVGAVLRHRPDEPVGDRVHDEHDLLVDADDVVVERGAADDVAARPLDVGGRVDDGRRVARAGGDRPLVRPERLAHDRRARPSPARTRTPGASSGPARSRSSGAATAATRFGGPPAPTIARLMSRTVSAEQRRAFGWALKTTAFPAETMLIVLLMIVEVGFVTGVIAATTPNGANSVTIMPASPVTAWTSRSSGPGALRGHEAVLDDLVLDAPEVRLLVGHPGEVLGVVEHGSPHGVDDLLPGGQALGPERLERLRGRRDGVVDRGVDPVAELRGVRGRQRGVGTQAGAGALVARGRHAPPDALDDLADLVLVDLAHQSIARYLR